MKTRQTKIDRSGATWLPGAMAIAATSAGAQAATVQITFNGTSYVSSSGGVNLVNDFGELGGDANIGGNVLFGGMSVSVGSLDYFGYIRKNLALASAGRVVVGATTTTGDEVAVRGLVGFAFTASAINGGSQTQGWLDIQATNAGGEFRVDILRFVFDDATTAQPASFDPSVTGAYREFAVVPEPSSMALLALGAGGLALRRSRKAKAA